MEGLGLSPSKPDHQISLGDAVLLSLPMGEAAADLGAETSQMPETRTRARKPMPSKPAGEGTRYAQIFEHIFAHHYKEGSSSFSFSRDAISAAARELKITLPKNIGDVIYSFRYRVELPEAIQRLAPQGKQWVIRPAGRAQYTVEAIEPGTSIVTPSPMMAETKLPHSTPSIIGKYALNQTQALLATMRYNRLIDTFSGVTCYSLQSHLRSTVPHLGQVETDEIYIGVDKLGAHHVFPVQARGARENLNVVKIEQDFALCAAKFPQARCRPIAAMLMDTDLIAMFEFSLEEHGVRVAAERHYRLVPAEKISAKDLARYSQRSE
jgi:hypothetical protein